MRKHNQSIRLIALILSVAALVSMSACGLPDGEESEAPGSSAGESSLPSSSAVNPPSVPSSAPATVPSSAPETVPASVPESVPSTGPVTIPVTPPTTQPVTVPVTPPTTQPVTMPVTPPTTQPITPGPVKVTGLIISGADIMYVGATQQLLVSVLPENAANRSVSWSITSNASKATITSGGQLTAKAAGSIVVKATARDGSGVSSTFAITIKEKTSAALWEGSGTQASPYLIKNLTDLKNLTTVTNKSGYYFKQVANIDAASQGQWVTIGSYDKPFRHHYDGGGYTISNLCLDGGAIALISYAEDANFKNIKIVNANTSTSSHYEEKTAALVGYATGCTFHKCTASVNFLNAKGNTAGLVGYVVLKKGQSDLMVDCHVSGTIWSEGQMGGLIAEMAPAFQGEEFAPSGAPSIRIKDCSSDAKLRNEAGRGNIGGLVGKSNLIKIEDCHATGDIHVSGGDVGGLVGYALYATEITRCYATGDITCTVESEHGGVSAGGLIGYTYALTNIHDCYATGDISVPNAGWSPCQDRKPGELGPFRTYYNPCGSLIGTLETMADYDDYHKIQVYHCYATGKVYAPKICEDERVYCHGALIGLVLDNYTVRYVIDKSKKDQSDWSGFRSNCICRFEGNYNLESLRTYYTPMNDYKYTGTSGLSGKVYSAMPTYEYVQIITNSQLTQQSTFVGWDFQNVWKMGANGPELR